jgi:hypothetical protein
MSTDHQGYPAARKQLIAFLQTRGYTVHPSEVFCPTPNHYWVDVAAIKDQGYWAFEYKSRTDSIRRGLEQCTAYASAFNYVVIVADRHRVTRSPYFARFKQSGFGVWQHQGSLFHTLIPPKRRTAITQAKSVVERQFKSLIRQSKDASQTKLVEFLTAESQGDLI